MNVKCFNAVYTYCYTQNTHTTQTHTHNQNISQEDFQLEEHIKDALCRWHAMSCSTEGEK